MTRSDGWYKDTDGVWRNPRYPKGGKKPHPDIDAGYNEETNGAWINVNGDAVELNFNELQWLMHQLYNANATAQAENSRLWKEKEAIMIEEDGYVPPVYQRGRRIN